MQALTELFYSGALMVM